MTIQVQSTSEGYFRRAFAALVLSAFFATALAAPPAFSEAEVSIGEPPLALPGTLTMPAGEGPFPAVLLVQGSGPVDRDGTVGPNRPLRDIAHGLAERGVATLRYDKRTLVHPASAANPGFGVDDEVTHDAVAAVAVLRASAGVDPDQVFVFGHSLGAMLTPRIVQRADGAAGGIMLAASTRTLLDLIPGQIQRMGELQGADPGRTAASVKAIESAIARIRAGEDPPPIFSPLGVPAAYWRTTEELDPIAEVRALQQPVLILHGGRDIQVADDDWEAWRAAFEGERRVSLKRYPELGHLGTPSDADDPLASYSAPGKVDTALIDDVARWIADR